jgi:UDP-N-acetylglucosamine 2-epimerase
MRLDEGSRLRIVSVVGARPQFVKLGPIDRAFAERRASGAALEHLVVHTGQHYDAAMSDVFFAELGMSEPAANLGIGSGSHAQQTGRMLMAIEAFLADRAPDAVIVYGDTNSTLAGALASTKLGLPTAHVEAGLRSFHRRMPEELNRLAVDHLSDLLLAPTQAAVANLAREGLGERTAWVGDVMLDAVLHSLELARARSEIVERLGLGGLDFAVATIHRSANTEPDTLMRLLAGLERVAPQLPVVLPIHPRTRAALRGIDADWQPAAGLRFVDPVAHVDMLRLVDAAALVITDSGGLQKEAFILGRPCVTLRDETEWVETVEAGANATVGADPGRLEAAVEHWRMRDWGRTDMLAAKAFSLYGEGGAAERIVEAVLDMRPPDD